jgi:ribonuclease D
MSSSSETLKLVSNSTWSSLESELKVNFHSGVKTIALDCEGVDLSRLGQVCLVQITSPTTPTTYLFDVLGLTAASVSPMLDWLRNLLENETICKVIHDCRMDSDALASLLNIQLTNVHDTSCWHASCGGGTDVNLNDCLVSYSLTPNALRGSINYDANPNYWAQRPVSKEMMAYASGDLTSLLEMQAKQLQRASASESAKAKAASIAYLNAARSARVEVVRVTGNIGHFIGPRGANIRELQKSTNTIIFNKGQRANKMFMVFYHTEEGLNQVKAQSKK